MEAPRPARATGVAAVELERVSKRFGDVSAVDGVSLRIRPGEVVALLGPNGGKTSTIDMVLGLSAPTEGTVSVYGMVGHPRGRPPRPHRRLRHALPGGGRRVRGPDRARPPRPDRRRRHRRPGAGAGGRRCPTPARDVEITSRNLEEALLTLTADDESTPDSTREGSTR